MRKQNLIAVSALGLIFSATFLLHSCSKIGNLLNFNLSMQTESVNVTIPASGDTTGTVTVGPTKTVFNVDSFIKSQTGNQLGASNINSVKLNSVVFTLNDADITNNFRDFQSVSASFTSNTNSTPYNVSIPNNPDAYATTLHVPVDSTVELKSYIGNSFRYYVTGKLRHATTKALDCTVTFTFSVNVRG